ncbi:hypothetical protein [Mesorhizobium sp. LNJC405B00]|uniref:hypothetical protein n=1 Tax=Mesorhizobium sp. LNJC405B00 TaxID=1287281 RepID=UPI0012EBA222|nr:hypothetical protein [Mesorhizobium sp. LNJC405B00]
MARSKEKRIGYLRGKMPDGTEAVVSVSKIGRDYRIGCGLKDHLCHPSVRDIEGVRREALLAFDVRDAIYQSI